MTNTHDSATSSRQQDAVEPKPADDEHRELDAEILSDLDADEAGDDVRGGACPKSKPV